MITTDPVLSLKLTKILKTATIESYWDETNNLVTKKFVSNNSYYGKDNPKFIKAPNFNELLKVLGKRFSRLMLCDESNTVFIAYPSNERRFYGISGIGETPQEALGNLLVNLSVKPKLADEVLIYDRPFKK